VFSYLYKMPEKGESVGSLSFCLIKNPNKTYKL
jgi:hypothetical protein